MKIRYSAVLLITLTLAAFVPAQARAAITYQFQTGEVAPQCVICDSDLIALKTELLNSLSVTISSDPASFTFFFNPGYLGPPTTYSTDGVSQALLVYQLNNLFFDNGVFSLAPDGGYPSSFVSGGMTFDSVDGGLTGSLGLMFFDGFLQLGGGPTWTGTYFYQLTPDIEFSGTWVQQPVPEPATLALLGLGIAGLGFARRRRQH